METIFNQINPDILLYGGVIGIFLGMIFFLFFAYRRIRWLFTIFSKRKRTPVEFFASLRNLIFIALWTAIFGMALFLGFFLRAYYVFTLEKPVAEIIVAEAEAPKSCKITLVQYISPDSQAVQNFTIYGDQWMLEGDIIKWDNWLNFLGVHTRYRLTRLRGRYLKTKDELEKKPSVYSLTSEEHIPFWQYLYDYGRLFPLVSTVYGNAAFQSAHPHKKFLVFVSTSGFVIRDKVR